MESEQVIPVSQSAPSRWFVSGKLGQNSEKVYQMQGLQLAIVIYRAWNDSLYLACAHGGGRGGDQRW